MIKSMTVVNYLGKRLKVTLSEAEPSHGLLIQSITGIGPADAVVNTSDYASNDGSEFNSARLDKRSIQITFMLRDNEHITVEEARHNTYLYFPTKKAVKLIFETDTRTVYCNGHVEHNTPDIFQEQEIATIDVVCEDPYFYKIVDGKEETDVDAALVVAEFSSEYTHPDDPTDESLSSFTSEQDTPSIEIGSYFSGGVVTKDLINVGDVETSFIAKIHFIDRITGDILIADDNGGLIKIQTSIIESLINGTIAAGDELELSTDPKYRYLEYTKNGVKTNVLNALDFSNLTWLMLYPGDNLISYYVNAGDDNTEVTFVYKTLCLGV